LSSSGTYQRIIALDKQLPNYYGVAFQVRYTNNLLIGYHDGGAPGPDSRRNKYGTTELNVDTWYHVATVLRGPTDMELYVNGVDDGGSYGGSGGSLAYSADGHSFIGGDSGTHHFVYGRLDDVRVYDRALCAEEIQELYLPPLAVSVDIRPGNCPNPLNVKSKGVLPVAILGTEDFDVNGIDAVSVRLAGIEPLRSSYEDVAGPAADGNECECAEEKEELDGYTDLTLKFGTQKAVEALGEVNDGDVLTVTLTGVLQDGTPIEGMDCILVHGKFKPFNQGDINKSGITDIVDFAMMAETWLESTISED
jgi:hypothetical protein